MVADRRSCNSCEDMGAAMPSNCAGLKKKLQTVDFAIVETALYLDAYPDSQKALEYYHRLVREREMLAEAYHTRCGPTTAWANKSTAKWDWINGPWPWEFDAN